MVKKIINNSQGFSLIEVMIALMIFGVYVTALIFSQSNNVSGSMKMASDLELHNLAEMKLNEILIRKKEFTNATENEVDSGAFEIEGYKNYKYEIKIRKNEFPDFAQIMGKSEDEDSDQNNSALQKLIFDKMKKNVEEILWQVNVKVTNTNTDESYELNSWINKTNAKLDTNFSF